MSNFFRRLTYPVREKCSDTDSHRLRGARSRKSSCDSSRVVSTSALWNHCGRCAQLSFATPPWKMRPHPRPGDVLRLCDRGDRRACCPEPTLTGGHKVRDASPTHVQAMFCDFVTAARDGLAAQGRLSPAVTRSEREAVCPTLFFDHPPLRCVPTHVPATFCDFVTAVRDGLAAQSRLSPAVTRSEMRPPPTSQRCSATL